MDLNAALLAAPREDVSASVLDLRLCHETTATVCARLDDRQMPHISQPAILAFQRHVGELLKPVQGHTLIAALIEAIQIRPMAKA